MTKNQVNIFVFGSNTKVLSMIVNEFIAENLSSVRIINDINQLIETSFRPRDAKLVYVPSIFNKAEYSRLTEIDHLTIYTVTETRIEDASLDINQYSVISFIKKIQSGAFNYNSLHQGYFLIKINNKLKRVAFDEIEYFESDGKYLNIYTEDRKYISRSSIKDILAKLPTYFLRVHLSFIVNLRSIKHLNVKDNNIQLSIDQVMAY